MMANSVDFLYHSPPVCGLKDSVQLGPRISGSIVLSQLKASGFNENENALLLGQFADIQPHLVRYLLQKEH